MLDEDEDEGGGERGRRHCEECVEIFVLLTKLVV